MSQLGPEFIIVFTTILISGIGIIIGTAIPSIMEGRAVLKALDGIIRQPEAADDIRTTLLISMALPMPLAISTWSQCKQKKLLPVKNCLLFLPIKMGSPLPLALNLREK